jgi:hypothetical protein
MHYEEAFLPISRYIDQTQKPRHDNHRERNGDRHMHKVLKVSVGFGKSTRIEIERNTTGQEVNLSYLFMIHFHPFLKFSRRPDLIVEMS